MTNKWPQSLSAAAPGTLHNIQNWFHCRWSKGIQEPCAAASSSSSSSSASSTSSPLALLVPLEIWAPAPSSRASPLAELLQHSGIHISAAGYELCTISSEKEFNDASPVRAASNKRRAIPPVSAVGMEMLIWTNLWPRHSLLLEVLSAAERRKNGRPRRVRVNRSAPTSDVMILCRWKKRPSCIRVASTVAFN